MIIKRIPIFVILLFITLYFFVGCAKIHVYTSDDIKVFENEIKQDYPNINKVQIRRIDVLFEITYVLTNPASNEEIQKLSEATKEYIKRDDLLKAISKEDKLSIKSLNRANMIVMNPDDDKGKSYHQVLRVLTKLF